MKNKILNLSIWISYLIILTGCTVLSPSPLSTVSTPIMSTASSLSTQQPSPTILSSSNPTSTVTPTKLSTLSPAQSENLFLNLLQDNNDCKFPCVFSITPGKTSAEMFREFIGEFGTHSTSEFFVSSTEYSGVTRIVWQLVHEKKKESYHLHTFFNHDNVEYLVFDAYEINDNYEYVYTGSDFIDNTKRFSLPQVMKDYGQPTSVYVWAWHNSDMPEVESSWSRLSLIIYYPENGFLIEYIVPTEIVNNQYRGCHMGAIKTVISWDQELNYSLGDVLERSSTSIGVNKNYVGRLKTADEAFNISEEEFFQVFQDSKNNCLFTPIELWPSFD